MRISLTKGYLVDAVLTSMRQAEEEYPDQRETWSPDAAVRWVQGHMDQAFAIGEIGLDGDWIQDAFWPKQKRASRRLPGVAVFVGRAAARRPACWWPAPT